MPVNSPIPLILQYLEILKIIVKCWNKVNEKIARDDYQERHRDRTLLEKIEDKYESLLTHGKISKLKGYYESQVDKRVEV